jgi:hypothetical protein
MGSIFIGGGEMKVKLKSFIIKWKAKIKKINNKTAILIGAITGSMFFFWIFAGVIAYVRAVGSPEENNLLTACENDIQVLLISVNNITSTMTFGLVFKVIYDVRKLLVKVEKKEDEICAELSEKVANDGKQA